MFCYMEPVLFCQVRCLDFVDFGPIQLPPTLPRIRVWKGNLIRLFGEMFMGTNGKYGSYPVSLHSVSLGLLVDTQIA